MKRFKNLVVSSRREWESLTDEAEKSHLHVECPVRRI